MADVQQRSRMEFRSFAGSGNFQRPACLTRRPLGLRATRQPLGGHKVAPLYFEKIVATRRDREAKICTRLPEYLAEVVFKFGVDPI